MNIETDQELLQIYFEEAEEHVQAIVQGLLNMEQHGAEGQDLNELYRNAHSLKGSSGIVKFDEIARIAHLVEDTFDAIRSDTTIFDDKLASLLLRSIDVISDCLRFRKSEKGTAPDTEPIKEELQGAMQLLQNGDDALGLEIFSQMSPELISVMTELDTKQLELAYRQKQNFYEILLYLQKDTFLDDIRFITNALQNVGQLLVKNRASESPDSESDIAFKFQFFSAHDSDYVSRVLNGFKHTIRKLDWATGAFEPNLTSDKASINQDHEQVESQELNAKAQNFAAIRNQYVYDSLEKLEKSIELVLDLEKHPTNYEVLDELFRTFHSFKGSGAGYDLPEVCEIAHEAESIMEKVRKSQLLLDATVIESLLRSLDKLNAIFNHAKSTSAESNTYEHSDTLQITEADSAGKRTKRVPVKTAVAGSDNNSETRSSPKSKNFVAEETLRVSLKKIDELVNISSEILVRREGERQVLQELRHCTDVARQLVRGFIKTKDEIKLEPQLRRYLDNGPFAKLFTNTSQRLIHLYEHLGKLQETVSSGAMKTESLTSTLQAKVMNVRMMPISTIFQKYQRLVRELSHSTGKDVRLEIKGETNELDKKVLEEIGDPLVHLIRNSIDHGLETPDERQRAGKPPTGTIKLEAMQVGNHMIIEVADDGRGIEPEKIRETAVQKGILAREKSTELSSKELLQLIFIPAFSTAKNITQISGRGVGLDVVKTNIGKLNGSIDVDTQVGKGTKFILKIPITLAIIRVLIINVAGLLCAVPAGVTERILKIDKSNLLSVDGQQVVQSQGEPLPAIRLSKMLGIETTDKRISESTGLVFSSIGRRVCIMLDKVERVQDVVLKNIGTLLKNVPFISGGCIMRDGEVVVILDIVSIARQALSPSTQISESRHVDVSKKSDQKVVMVVEDSLISRDMLTSILAATGYKVLEASDGLEALSILRRQKCDLVVTDIIMPNMTGFELTQAIRSRQSLSNLPVVIVTNKEKDQDRVRGMQAGADAYIVKSRFDQKNLLSTVEDLLKT